MSTAAVASKARRPSKKELARAQLQEDPIKQRAANARWRARLMETEVASSPSIENMNTANCSSDGLGTLPSSYAGNAKSSLRVSDTAELSSDRVGSATSSNINLPRDLMRSDTTNRPPQSVLLGAFVNGAYLVSGHSGALVPAHEAHATPARPQMSFIQADAAQVTALRAAAIRPPPRLARKGAQLQASGLPRSMVELHPETQRAAQQGATLRALLQSGPSFPFVAPMLLATTVPECGHVPCADAQPRDRELMSSFCYETFDFASEDEESESTGVECRLYDQPFGTDYEVNLGGFVHVPSLDLLAINY